MIPLTLFLVCLTPSLLLSTPISRTSASLDNHKSSLQLHFIHELSVPDVSFANIITSNNAKESKSSLFLSSFTGNPFASDHVSYFPQASTALSSLKPTPMRINGSITWPNTIEYAPASVFGKEGVVASGGFLVPGKTNGGIWFSETYVLFFLQLFKIFSNKKQ